MWAMISISELFSRLGFAGHLRVPTLNENLQQSSVPFSQNGILTHTDRKAKTHRNPSMKHDMFPCPQQHPWLQIGSLSPSSFQQSTSWLTDGLECCSHLATTGLWRRNQPTKISEQKLPNVKLKKAKHKKQNAEVVTNQPDREHKRWNAGQQ
ncbi:uncharacterized protein RBU33_016996 isoform 2-T2 [Hipposideros larvatus]